MRKTWPLPPHAISLLSFIGLCSFYSRYCPWFETNFKPLRKLQREYHRQPIPILSWTSPLISLFNDCKAHLVSSPLLLRYDSTKPAFLKTDWSAGGMGYILMQADDTSQSVATVQLLEGKGECAFDLSLGGPRLRLVFFGSRSDQPFEIHYHSFVGEVACGRWAISFCRRYLWGKFYWIFDCIAVKEILEYTGSIHQLHRWSQERLGYEFANIHRAASIMKDVDGLSRHIDVLIHRCLIQASCMHLAHRTTRPFAYSFDSFVACSNPHRVTTSDTTKSTAASSLLSPLSIIHHSPLHFTSPSILQSYSVPKSTSNTFRHVVPPEDMIWLSFDSITTSFGSLLSL